MCADAGILTVHGGGGGGGGTADYNGWLGYGCDFAISVNYAPFNTELSSYSAQGAVLAKAFTDASASCIGHGANMYSGCVCPKARSTIESLLGSKTPAWVPGMCY